LFQQNSAANTLGLKPVKVRSAEVGVRGNLANRVIYTVGLYEMTARDDILTFTTPENTREALNAGETVHRGLEIGAGVAITSDLRVDAAWSSALHRYVHWIP